jgi:tRNA A-37 threonylcarbamoyl transferase component Bud32/tetratricopeptide (TPR) repeat protein
MASVPTKIGRYRVVQPIGQGGMGSIYLAWDEHLERHIVIKVLKEDDEGLRARFSREAKSAARLKHTHIVTIFELGEYESEPYIAMEYIEGPTLGEVIAGRDHPPLQRKLELMAQLCDGLGYAHKAGVVHRDIKPANIMIHKDGDLKILDFGVARLAESASMTQAGMMIGTLNYMSPEQVSGDPIDHRSDIFAVGSVFYEFLSRKKAFPGGVSSGVLGKILHGQPEPLGTHCPGLDEEIIRIVSRAYEKNVADRYQDLEQMRREILAVHRRLEASDATQIIDTPSPRREPPSEVSHRVTRRASDAGDLAKRRASQVQYYLELAERAAAENRLDSAIAACEQALLLDADNARALELSEQARATQEALQAQQLLDEAERELERGSLTTARDLVDQAGSLQSSTRYVSLRKAVEHAIEEREQVRQRAEALRDTMDRAQTAFSAGNFADAMRLAAEALAQDPAHAPATLLKARAADALAQRAREASDQRARQAVTEARQACARGDYDAAISLLDRFSPAHELVTRARAEIAAEAERVAEQRRRDAETRARQQRINGILSLAREELRDRRFTAAFERLRALEKTEGSSPEIARLLLELTEAQAEYLRAEQADRAAAERREREAEDARANQIILEARQLFSQGHHDTAIARLAGFTPPNELVTRTRNELAAEARRIADQRRKEAETAARQQRISAGLALARQEAGEQRFVEAMERLRALEHAEGATPAITQLLRETSEAQAAHRKRQEAAEQARRKTQADLQRARGARSDDEALAVLTQLLEHDPQNSEAQTLLLERQTARKDREQADKTLLLERRQQSSEAKLVELRPEVEAKVEKRQAADVAVQREIQPRRPMFWPGVIAAAVLVLGVGGYLTFGRPDGPPIVTPTPTPTPTATPTVTPTPTPTPPDDRERQKALARAAEFTDSGNRLLREGKLAEAAEAFRQAQVIVITPETTAGLDQIDRRRREFQQAWQNAEQSVKAGDLNAALSSYQTARQLDPESYQKQDGSNRVKAIQGQMSEAERRKAQQEEAERKRKAAEAARIESISLLGQGRDLARKGQYDEAEGMYRKAQAVDPNNADAADALQSSLNYRKLRADAEALRKAGDVAAARQALNELRKLDGERFRDDGLDKVLAALSAPPPTPTVKLTPTPPPDERPQIWLVIQAFARSVSTETNPRKDMGLVRQIWAGAPNYFDKVDTQKVEFSAPEYSIQTPTRVSVICQQLQQWTSRGSRQPDSRGRVRIELEKRGATWVIISLRAIS